MKNHPDPIAATTTKRSMPFNTAKKRYTIDHPPTCPLSDKKCSSIDLKRTVSILSASRAVRRW